MPERRTHRPITVAALMLGLFMGALEMTVVSTAMPTAIGDLGGIQIYSWVFAIYMLGATVTGPLYGKLADIYGRKPIFLFGAVVFSVASMACGYAETMFQLVVLRAVQGIGAGALGPIAITIIGDIFTLEERGRVQGFFGGVWGVAGLVGPMLGGLIVKFASWRWVFFVNVPVGIAAIVLLSIGFHERIEKRSATLDLSGGAVLTAGIVALLLGVGRSISAWIALPAALILLAIFVVIEQRAKDPLLPLDLFRQPTIGLATLCNALLGAMMIGEVTYIPFFVQAVLGGSPTEAGSAVTPMVVTWPIASMTGGMLVPRLGFRPFVRIGFTISAIGSILLAIFLTPGSGLAVPRIASSIIGIGLGFASTSLLLAVQTSVPWTQRGVATAGTMFARNIGGTLSVGVMGGILSAYFAGSAEVSPEVASQLLGPEHGRSLAPEILRTVSGILEQGLGTIFWLIAAIGVATFFVGLLFPAVPVPARESPGRVTDTSLGG